MFNHKIKNNPVHMLIMDQINDVENCLIQFQSFIRASSAPNVSIIYVDLPSNSVISNPEQDMETLWAQVVFTF